MQACLHSPRCNAIHVNVDNEILNENSQVRLVSWFYQLRCLQHYLCVYAAGIKDASSVNPDVTLRDLGIDSLMGVEVRQILQRNYDISLSAEEIRALTFAKLDQMSTPRRSRLATLPQPSIKHLLSLWSTSILVSFHQLNLLSRWMP